MPGTSAPAPPPVAVKVKPGTKFYHGAHGHHHFEEGREILLPSDIAEKLVRDALVDLVADAAEVSEATPAAEAEEAPPAA